MKENTEEILHKKENKKFLSMKEKNYNQIQEKIEFLKKGIIEEENINQKRLHKIINFYHGINDSLEDKKISKKNLNLKETKNPKEYTKLKKENIRHKIINKLININELRSSLMIMRFLFIKLFIIITLIEKLYAKKSYITLKVFKKGNIYIYGDDNIGTHCGLEHAPLPDEIHINGVNQSIIKTVYYLSEPENNITLLWNNPINRATCMFLNCHDIVEIDLSNFDSSQVTHLHAMFYGCSSLKNVGLSNFNSPQAKDISRMFLGCSSLTSVNLSSFSASQLTEVYGIFDGCSSLEYINLQNLMPNDNLNYNSIFSGISEKVIFCSKYNKWKEIFSGCPFINCFANITQINNNENSYDEQKCYKKCTNNPIYINPCEKCGKYYEKINNDNSVINCFNIPEGYYLDLNDSYSFVKPCYSSCRKCEIGGNETFHNCISCFENDRFELKANNYINCYTSNEIKTNVTKSEIENFKKILINNYKKLEYLNGKDIEMEIQNIIITLTTTDNQKSKNLGKNKTVLDLSECENILKKIIRYLLMIHYIC